MSLARFAVNAPVKVTMVFAAIMILGWISLQRLPTSLFPDLRAPKVTTTIKTTGLSPVEVERRINEPLERQLYTIRGVADVTTIARADTAVVITEFTWDTPLDFAFLDVKKVVADIQRQNPQEIESAAVLRYDPNAAPIMTIALAGDNIPLEDLRRFAERTLRPRFERLDGVANVVVSGGEEPEIHIALDQALLLAYGIDVAQVVTALQNENVNATGGYVREGASRFLLKAVGEFANIDQVRSVVVTRKGNAAILLQDIARVEYVPQEHKDFVLSNGRPAVGLSFYREAEGNTVSVVNSIAEEIKAIEGKLTGPKAPPSILPPGVSIVISNDQSQFIRAAINEVRDNALQGAVLAILVLLVFLRNIRTTIIIAISIPVSIIATFNLMYFQGLSLNLMTLGGLALGVGMLVDNAIVVLENIFRLSQEGHSPRDAAHQGSKQVAGAIIASTLTTIVVFLPIIYVKGVAGLLFKEQALTVGYSLFASLIVALLLIPMLASKFLAKPPKAFQSQPTPLGAQRGIYPWLLRKMLRVRLLVLIAACATFYLTWKLFATIPQEFLPRTSQRQIGVRLVLPGETRIESTRRVVESLIGQLGQYAPAIENTYARIGESEGQIQAGIEDPDGPNTADLYISLHDKPTSEMLAAGLANFNSNDIVLALKPAIDQIPGAKADFKTQQGSIFDILGTSGSPLLMEITGEDLQILTRLAEEAQNRLQSTPGLINVRTNILEGTPEVHLVLDKPQLARLGLDVQTVAATIRRRLEGETAGQIKRDIGDVDLRVDVDYGVESLETLREIILTTPSGARVPLGNIAAIQVERGPREIVRRRQVRIARVMAELEQDINLSQAIERSNRAIAGMYFPSGYTWSFTGEEEQRADAFQKLAFALLLSTMLVYMVMASIFESFLQPLLIMITIPLAGAGVAAALLLTGSTLNVMALIGIVMLGGIVVNNAIVLLDCVNQLRAEDPTADQRETLVAGCHRRLRPVLMTTLTTLLGLLPLALGIGEGAELRRPLALAVLGGLLSSTLLTLFIIPIGQSYLDFLTTQTRRLLRSKVKTTESTEEKQEDTELS